MGAHVPVYIVNVCRPRIEPHVRNREIIINGDFAFARQRMMSADHPDNFIFDNKFCLKTICVEGR